MIGGFPIVMPAVSVINSSIVIKTISLNNFKTANIFYGNFIREIRRIS